jgi:tyrosyl-tRNA synthetase
MLNIEKQLEVIKRGAVQIISEEELRKKLQEGRPLRVKAGFDPTAPDIHLGHTVLLRKLRQFQDLGHKVIFLIGDFTGRIGDPSGRSQIRPQLTPAQVKRNAVTYKKQVGKILNLRKLEIAFNSRWFARMPPLEFAQLFSHYTATRLLERDDFSKRLQEQKPLFMSELIYPLLQGYDSVILKSDIELGGTDQIFNLLVGRDLQKDFAQPQQVVITMPLLEGTDGVQKMSKSYGNFVGINEPAVEIFGKLMSISDEMMFKYYELLTDEDMLAVKSLHPKEAKMRLAQSISAQYHGQPEAKRAREEFARVFGAKEIPQEMPQYQARSGEDIVTVLVKSGLVKSGNEARRLIKQQAVSFENLKVSNENFAIDKPGIIKAGSRRFLKVTL